MDAQAILQTLHPAGAPRKSRRLAEPSAAGHEPSDGPAPDQGAEPVGAGSDARYMLALVDSRRRKQPKTRGCQRTKVNKQVGERHFRLRGATKQLLAKAARFNASGFAVTSDALMCVGAALGQGRQALGPTRAVRGSSA